MKAFAILRLFLTGLVSLAITLNAAVVGVDGAPTFSDEKQYSLQSLVVWTNAQEEEEQIPLYAYHEENNQEGLMYMLSLEQVDANDFANCQATGAVAYNLGFHVVNRFRVVACLTPQHDDDPTTTTFRVQLLTRMSSTRILPPNPAEQQLEMFWKTTLPKIRTLQVQQENDDALYLTSPNGMIEIVFGPVAVNPKA